MLSSSINRHLFLTSSHWFLAVICFPGLVGCRNMEDDSPVDTPESQTLTKSNKPKKKTEETGAKRILQIGSTSIIPLKGGLTSADKIFLGDDDASDRDEADASDDDMMDEEDSPFSFKKAPNTPAKTKSRSPTPPKDKEPEKKPEEAKSGGKSEENKSKQETEEGKKDEESKSEKVSEK